jgi:hypothetical protein
MHDHGFSPGASETGARRLSRRALTRSGAGLTAGAVVAGRLGRVAARQADATPVAGQPPTWEEIDQLFAAASPEATVLAAELIDGRCLPIHAYNADTVFPIGSTFKLWILGALALEIQAGAIDWEQAIEFNELYRSVPGGDLRFALPGSRYTVRYLAERMVQKSDNTAATHLFNIVGREKIEAAMIAMGHSNPALNIPLLSIKDVVFLKFGYTSAELDAFYASPVEERRRILDEEILPRPLSDVPDVGQVVPLEIDRVEWFATRMDLCETMNWLDLKAMEPGMLPVTEVIALETQLELLGEIWPYAGFKGGSELGVLSGTWLLHRADYRHFVYSVGFKNPGGAVDFEAAVAAMEAGRDRLALTP